MELKTKWYDIRDEIYPPDGQLVCLSAKGGNYYIATYRKEHSKYLGQYPNGVFFLDGYDYIPASRKCDWLPLRMHNQNEFK